jgi:hypothetical protein
MEVDAIQHGGQQRDQMHVNGKRWSIDHKIE